MKRLFFSDFKRPSALVAIASTFVSLVLSLPVAVEAATLVSSRAELASNDEIDWSSLGQVFDPLNPDPTVFLSNSFTATSPRGLDLNVDIPARPDLGVTPPFVFQTLPLPEGISTNFSSGDFLLFTGLNLASGFPAIGNPGPLTITFDEPVLGAGAQFAVDDTFNFDATISAFDEAGMLLATFLVPGTASVELDNSAVFLGVQSETANIARLEFGSLEPDRAFAINTLDLVVPIPEPAAIAGLLMVGAIAVFSHQK
ncbi:MAG: hypothetical protein AAGE59_34850 [Cyanobacteria bacterium P01_F01_bin.86]